MPYGNFVGYEPADGGALDFSTRDGKKLRLVGQAADELKQKLDASPFTAPSEQRISAVPQNIPLEAAAQSTATAPINTSPRTETTALSDADEKEFRKWAKKNRLRDVDHPDSHYDYRGFFKENQGKQVRDAAHPDAHFTDTYKQHGHPTFSEESGYSSGEGDGGHWEDGERFVPPKNPYVPPVANPLVKWLRNDPEPAPAPPPEPSHEEKQAALMAWIRGDDPIPLKSGKDARVPEKFQTFEPPQVRPGRTFARAAVEGALDAAALPVVAASKAADYVTGRDSSMSHLSGKDAAESLEYLTSGADPAEIRREEAFAEGEIPQAQTAGKFVGEYAGGAPLAALTGRVPAFSAVMHAAAPKTGHQDAEAEPPIPAWALQKPKAPEYRTPAAVRAKAVAAHKVIAEHPDADALRDYMVSGYESLNRNLRKAAQGEQVFPQFEAQAQAVDRVLESVKAAGLSHNGPTMRGLELPSGTVDKWIKAGAVQNKSFWSTTHNPDVADAFRGKGGYPGKESVQLKLDQRSGVPVAGPEDEILIPRNKNWVVKDHETLDDGTRVIELKEVPKLPPGVKPELSYDTSRLGTAAARAV